MGLFDGTILERPVICNRCGLDIKECPCPPAETPDIAPGDQQLKIALEKRKKGKQVTVVRGFECRKIQIQELLQLLKNSCGAGGTCDANTIEIQGNHAEKVRSELKKVGYRLK